MSAHCEGEEREPSRQNALAWGVREIPQHDAKARHEKSQRKNDLNQNRRVRCEGEEDEYREPELVRTCKEDQRRQKGEH
jgi:hypothetical protein